MAELSPTHSIVVANPLALLLVRAGFTYYPYERDPDNQTSDYLYFEHPDDNGIQIYINRSGRWSYLDDSANVYEDRIIVTEQNLYEFFEGTHAATRLFHYKLRLLEAQLLA